MDHFKKDKPEVWSTFEKKITNIGTLIYSRDIFVQYVEHILRKFIKNGYQRVEFRAELVKLSEYNCKGHFVGKLNEEEYARYFDEAAKKVEEEHPDFSVGIIFGIRKSWTEDKITEEL